MVIVTGSVHEPTVAVSEYTYLVVCAVSLLMFTSSGAWFIRSHIGIHSVLVFGLSGVIHDLFILPFHSIMFVWMVDSFDIDDFIS